MSDLFHAKVPVSVVQDVFAVIAATPQHTTRCGQSQRENTAFTDSISLIDPYAQILMDRG